MDEKSLSIERVKVRLFVNFSEECVIDGLPLFFQLSLMQ